MKEQFSRLKRGYIVSAAIISAAIGLSCGMCAAGAVLLALKLSKIIINPAYYALIGVGVALAAFGIAFILLKPTDKKTAERLDKVHDLKDRVSTALAFGGQDSDVLSVQREDTAEKLKEITAEKPNFKKILCLAVAFALSLSLFVCSLCLPYKSEQPPVVPPPPPVVDDNAFALSDFQEAAVEEITQTIQNSHISEGVKGDIAQNLAGLLTSLRAITRKDEMQRTVAASIVSCDALLRAECTYFAAGNALYEGGSKQLATAIALGTEFYKRYPMAEPVNLSDFYAGCRENSEAQFAATLDDMQEEAAGLLALYDSAPADYSDFVAAAGGGLAMAQDSALKTILSDFCSALGEAASAQADMRGTALKSAFDSFAYSLAGELSSQAYNLAAGNYIYTALSTAFTVPASMINIPSWNLGETVGAGDTGDEEHGGGFGDGDQVYGSDDEIYDPLTQKYVKYGEILQRYYDIVQEFLNGGTLTEEQASMVRAYFNILYGGLEEE